MQPTTTMVLEPCELAQVHGGRDIWNVSNDGILMLDEAGPAYRVDAAIGGRDRRWIGPGEMLSAGVIQPLGSLSRRF